MWFFTADLHLKHNNIIKYCNRPFQNEIEKNFLKMAHDHIIPINDVKISDESTDLMTNSIIDSINHVVGKNDKLVIVGDFCYSRSKDRNMDIANLRERINCNNLYLIIGNHDDRECVKNHFVCFEQYTFNIDGQSIFTSHYPCRSWNKKIYNSWMLYGHTHSHLSVEDNGGFLTEHKQLLILHFSNVLSKHNITNQYDLLKDLMSAATHTKGLDLCLDVGVDNIRHNVPFGTPWSMDEIRDYMNSKKNRINSIMSFLK